MPAWSRIVGVNARGIAVGVLAPTRTRDLHRPPAIRRPRAVTVARTMTTLTYSPALRLESLVRDFGSGEGVVRALDGVTLGFELGTFTAVMGPSGSGKSTLLQTAAGL